MARKRRTKKDRTSLVIAAVLHLALLAGVIYWAHKTGALEEWIRRGLELVRSEKKAPQPKGPKQPPPPPPPPKAAELPKINQPSRPMEGTRRAVSALPWDSSRGYGPGFSRG